MKSGKYVSLGTYQNVRIGYGTIDYKELKTIFIKLKSWVIPMQDFNYEDLISKTRKKIKIRLFNQTHNLFQKESIVDLNFKTNRIKVDKMSFMDGEITLFTKFKFDIKDEDIKNQIGDLIKDIIDNDFNDKNFYNFNENKK